MLYYIYRGEKPHSPQKTMTTKFETNTKYFYRFVCDSNSYVEIKVLKRTAKTVTIEDKYDGVSRRKISVDDEGVEFISPTGTYSMSPICRATRRAV